MGNIFKVTSSEQSLSPDRIDDSVDWNSHVINLLFTYEQQDR